MGGAMDERPAATAPSWPADEAAAVAEQERLRGLVDVTVPGPEPADGLLVAGVDVAYDDARDRVVAAAVVVAYPGLAVVEETTAEGRVSFPYVPGLLAFRELPAVLEALGRLRHAPDLVVCDGYGVAHPRRLGLASHLGVLTGIPAFGVAKTPFLYAAEPPGAERGARSPMQDGEETVGSALRTRPGVKPVYVSAGHLIDLEHACAHTLALTTAFRLPETTRRADQLCRRVLAGR
jgi:deoxyribonuclease V